MIKNTIVSQAWNFKKNHITGLYITFFATSASDS